MHSLDMAFFW